MGKYFGTDGVRGVAGADLTCELAMKIGRGAAAVLTGSTGHRPRILIGKDTRQSGDMLEAALPLLPESITHLGATVSPANPYSLSNALACGFTIRARREMYGGFDRYLLAKEL